MTDAIRLRKSRGGRSGLATVFNRGFWDGYHLGQRLGEWSDSCGSQAARRRHYLGKGVDLFKKQQVAEFIIEADSLSTGERVLIIYRFTLSLTGRKGYKRFDIILVD